MQFRAVQKHLLLFTNAARKQLYSGFLDTAPTKIECKWKVKKRYDKSPLHK